MEEIEDLDEPDFEYVPAEDTVTALSAFKMAGSLYGVSLSDVQYAQYRTMFKEIDEKSMLCYLGWLETLEKVDNLPKSPADGMCVVEITDSGGAYQLCVSSKEDLIEGLHGDKGFRDVKNLEVLIRFREPVTPGIWYTHNVFNESSRAEFNNMPELMALVKEWVSAGIPLEIDHNATCAKVYKFD